MKPTGLRFILSCSDHQLDLFLFSSQFNTSALLVCNQLLSTTSWGSQMHACVVVISFALKNSRGEWPIKFIHDI